MKSLNEIIGSNIAFLRKENKLTQLEFGNLFSYSDKMVSKWEKGLIVPSAETLKNIADYFHVNIDFLFTEHPDDFQLEKNKQDDNKKKITIIALSASFIFSIAIVIYVASIFNYGSANNPYWRVFLWAVPVTLLFATLLIHKLFRNYKAEMIINSLFVWTILLSAFFSFIYKEVYWYLFIIGIPLQISIILVYQLSKNK